jgi:hypothetical protein
VGDKYNKDNSQETVSRGSVRSAVDMKYLQQRRENMYVRKVKGQDRVGKITLTPTEVAVLKKQGVRIEDYVRHALNIIAKKRRWKWFFNQGKA